MLGPITLSGDPAIPLHAATKQYVDANAGAPAGEYVPLAGGTMTGPLHLYGDPVTELESVPKRYLEYMMGALEAGVEIYGVFEAVTGTIRWNSNSGQSGNTLPTPVTVLEGRYLICSNEGDVPPVGAPLEHYMAGDWLICNGVDAWFHIHIAMGFMANEIEVNPAVGGQTDVQAALEYLDSTGGSGGGTGYLPLTGGNMTGPLNLFQDPLADMESVPRRYLEQRMGALEAGVEIYGVFDATTGVIRWNSNSGQSGNTLPPPANQALEGRYLICSTEGNVPPAGAPAEFYLAGDWLICNGVDAWFHIHTATSIEAVDIELNPAVNGIGNVQDAIEALASSGITDAPNDGQQYGRQSLGWTPITANTGAYLPLTGGTLTGPLAGTIATFTGDVTINHTTTNVNGRFVGTHLGSSRWEIALGDSPDQSGNRDNDFVIERFSNNGTYLGTPFAIFRDSGVTNIDDGLVVHGSDGGWNTLDCVQMGNPTPGGDWTGMYYVGTGGPDWDGEVGYLNTGSWSGSCVEWGGNFVYGGGTGQAYKNGGGTWSAISDARIKTVQSDYTLGLDAVLALRPVVYTFNGNDTPSADVMVHKGEKPKADANPVTAAPYPASNHAQVATAQTPFVGLIAQEVELVMPGMVGAKPGYIDGVATDIKTLDTNELIYALVNSIKELSTQISTQNEYITSMNERITALEGVTP